MDDIKNVEHYGEKVFEDIASHHLPVIVYGASEYASHIAHCLYRNGINVYGYAIDEKYFRKAMFCEKPVFVWEEIKKHSDAYVFVLGTCVRRKMVKRFLEDSSICSYCIASPDGEYGRITYDYVKKHFDEFNETYRWLSDDLSRKTFGAYLNMKISGDISCALDVSTPPEKQYFNNLTESFRGGGFVDCGAYDGDTVEQYIRWSEGKYKKIYAFEADERNRERMQGKIREREWNGVEVLPYGVWDTPGALKFTGGGTNEFFCQ